MKETNTNTEASTVKATRKYTSNKPSKVTHELGEALGVILLTDLTREWLEANDPMALRQAERALRHYGQESGRWPLNSRRTPSHSWGVAGSSPLGGV